MQVWESTTAQFQIGMGNRKTSAGRKVDPDSGIHWDEVSSILSFKTEEGFSFSVIVSDQPQLRHAQPTATTH